MKEWLFEKNKACFARENGEIHRFLFGDAFLSIFRMESLTKDKSERFHSPELPLRIRMNAYQIG
jgi:hypothetical protein